MKILLLGSNGRLGKSLKKSLNNLGELIAFDKNHLNLEDLSSISKILKKVLPDVIVNAAAYTNVNEAENKKTLALMINSDAVSCLARYAAYKKILLVHYSTNYVFDGQKNQPYLETDFANPINFYGYSKISGENAILSSRCDALIFRIGWLFSANSKNFMTNLIHSIKQPKKIAVIADQYVVPTSTEVVANVSNQSIYAFLNNQLKSGIYNISPLGQTTWYHWAVYTIYQATVIQEKKFSMTNINRIFPVSQDNFLKFNAKRPKNACLNNQKIIQDLGITLPHWSTDVQKTVHQFLTNNMQK